MGSPRFRRTILAVLLLSAPAVLAQDPNVCDEPGDAPDVIVGDLYEVNSYGNVGDILAYSVGTTSCNIGTFIGSVRFTNRWERSLARTSFSKVVPGTAGP